MFSLNIYSILQYLLFFAKFLIFLKFLICPSPLSTNMHRNYAAYAFLSICRHILIIANEFANNYLSFQFLFIKNDFQGVIEIGVSEKVKVARLIIRLNGCIQTRWKNKISDIMYESNEQILNDFIDLTRFGLFSIPCSTRLLF